MRRAIAFSELLQHPDLVRMMGTWESDDTIFVGECMGPAACDTYRVWYTHRPAGSAVECSNSNVHLCACSLAHVFCAG